MKTKICGITRLQDAILAAELGAWAIGFIFYPSSPRYIDPASARKIVRALPLQLRTVGVFVNATLAEIEATRSESGISSIQLHGDESPGFCNQTGPSWTKAFALSKLAEVKALRKYSLAEAVLIDAKVGNLRGGTGQLASWELAERAKAFHPKLILAGGLNAFNVRSAIEYVRPYGIDISSAIESAPGIKDPVKMKAFFRKLEES